MNEMEPPPRPSTEHRIEAQKRETLPTGKPFEAPAGEPIHPKGIPPVVLSMAAGPIIPLVAGTKVAVIDIGSNSIKCLVATRGKDGNLAICHEETEETRLSASLGSSQPEISPTAFKAGVEAVRRLVNVCLAWQPKRIKLTATSMLRDAVNGDAFREQIQRETGYPVTLLSGDEEARLIAQGVSTDPELKATGGSFILFDLGGGSLELIRVAEGVFQQKVSLPLGAVRLAERFHPDPRMPLNEEAQKALADHVAQAIKESGFGLSGSATGLVGTGGGVTVTRFMLGAEEAGECAPAVLNRREMKELQERLCAMNLEGRLQLPALPAKRADIMPTALVTIHTVTELAGVEVLTHSFRNLRFGTAAELLAELTQEG